MVAFVVQSSFVLPALTRPLTPSCPFPSHQRVTRSLLHDPNATAQALSLDDIVRYLPDAASVLAALPSIAILVRGSWVALSTVVFGVEAEEADSPATMAVQPLVDARDFVVRSPCPC